MDIDATAVVSDSAEIGAGTRVGPFAVIEAGARIGRDCRIAAHAVVRGCVCLGDGVSVDAFAALGGDPQSLGFDLSTASGVRIGGGAVIREGVTVHRAMEPGGETRIGADCYLMAQAHVAHDCVLEDRVVLCNNAMLGGHVVIGAGAFVGGGAGLHQFCRIGAGAMIAGNASITADVPPYVMAADRSRAHGLNLVGLRRLGMERREIADLKRCYRAVFAGGGNMKLKAAAAVREHEFGVTPAGSRFLSFFEGGRRGFVQAGKSPPEG